MTFQEACGLVYQYSKKPGIKKISETENEWIFIEAEEEKGVTEYNSKPIIVNKLTGAVRFMEYGNEEDWRLFDHSTEIEVPNKYRPIYE